ncbi:ATP-binding protein [Maribacter halichondriae]|uniref:ATP-binding protein n=1 Tax=Maribacter halichondriae TaxID=2980554 RepID=UPI00235A1632|nr:HAMP domain-containing sensor histidine kinase [Maribacter sp. Hal144]
MGDRLEMFTGQQGKEKSNHVAFDWSEFKDDVSLTSVPLHLGYNKKVKNEQGTKLVITKLRDPQKWKGSSWDRFRGQISQMVFPFKEKRIFDVYLKLNGKNEDLDELSERVRQNSVSSYTYKITEDKLMLTGEVKLRKLAGGGGDALKFYEQNIMPDNGANFFSFLTDPKNNKKYHLTNVEYSGKKGQLFTFTIEKSLADISKVSWIIKDDSKPDRLSLAHPGEFNGEIDDFFFKDSDTINQAFDSLSEFKRIVQNQVGIRVFRDGFGIKPYGIDGQDWLKLSQGATSGSSIYGLRPGNVIGYVAITAKENSNLREKTDREGFMDSPYSRNFHRFMGEIVERINDTLESTRRSLNDYRSKVAKEAGNILSISESFTSLKKASEKAHKSTIKTQNTRKKISDLHIKASEQFSKKGIGENERALLNEVMSLLEQASRNLEEVEGLLEEAKLLDKHVEFLQPQIEGLQEQLTDFSQLAGLGLTAEALSHQLSNILDRLEIETDRVSKHIRSQLTIDGIQAVKLFIEHVKGASKSFKKQLSHLAPSLKYVRESREIIAVADLIEETKEFYIDRFDKQIKVVVIHKGTDFNLNINKGKMVQILDNIIINSEYWLLQKKKREPQFLPEITLEIREPVIQVYDNGSGIDPTVEDRIFQPFITTKPKKIGRGLGLFIVQQMLESEGCEILLLNKKTKLEEGTSFN